MTFLGMIGISTNLVEDYDIKCALITQADDMIANKSIKQELQVAPALGTPDYAKQFLLCYFYFYVLFLCTKYVAVLLQESCQGRKKQLLAYYSTKLDCVVQGWPPCYQGMAALYYAYNKASSLTMGYPITIYTHHKVTELVEQGKFVLTVPGTLQ